MEWSVKVSTSNFYYTKGVISVVTDRLAHAKIRLDAYYAAELAVLSNQEYTIAGRTLKRADLGAIKAAIKELENHVAELESQVAGKGKNRVFGVIPRDI